VLDFSAVSADLIAVELKGGAGNDTLIGTPFNDVLDGGLGDDVFTGGLGLDVFQDAGGNNTLVETQETDMSLFGNYFVTGTILGSNGGSYIKGALVGEDVLRNAIAQESPTYAFTQTDPGIITPRGRSWSPWERSSAASSSPEGRGTSHGRGEPGRDPPRGSTTLAVTPWNGTVQLDDGGNTLNGSPEYILVYTAGHSGARINVDNNGSAGNTVLVVNGTNQSDTMHLTAAGSEPNRTGTIAIGDVSSAALGRRHVSPHRPPPHQHVRGRRSPPGGRHGRPHAGRHGFRR